MIARVRACRLLGGAAIALSLCACPRRPPLPTPAPMLNVKGQGDGLNVFLTWSAPVDLDLYVTDPTQETVYFGNNPSRTGGQLLRDARCGDVREGGPFLEQARVSAPKIGRYRVGVDFIDRCAAPRQPVSFRIVALLGGAQREITGTISPEQFQPVALEFELRPQGQDDLPTLVEEGR